MTRVVLVRHAMPEPQRDVPAQRWRLGDDARAAARALAGALPRTPLTLTSDEPKAQQTAEEEPHDAVVERFDAAVRAGLGASQGAPLVVVSHGQALTLWLRGVGSIDDAPAFWAELAFPDAWMVSVRWSGEALLADGAPARVT